MQPVHVLCRYGNPTSIDSFFDSRDLSLRLYESKSVTILALSLQVSSTAGPMEEETARNGSSPTSLNVALQLAPIKMLADEQQSLYFLDSAEFLSAHLLSGQ
jgi:hypothetical protein